MALDKPFKAFLTRRATLWMLFVALVAMFVALQIIKINWNIILLDLLSTPEDVRHALSQMSTDQRIFHAWLTATFDVVFPLVIGGLMVGVMLALFERHGLALSAIPVIAVGVDYLEGFIQILALLDFYYFLGLKSVATPLKAALYAAGAAIVMFAWGKWLFGKLVSPQA